MAFPTFQSANTVSEHTFHDSIIQVVGTFVRKRIQMNSFFLFQMHWMDQESESKYTGLQTHYRAI